MARTMHIIKEKVKDWIINYLSTKTKFINYLLKNTKVVSIVANNDEFIQQLVSREELVQFIKSRQDIIDILVSSPEFFGRIIENKTLRQSIVTDPKSFNGVLASNDIIEKLVSNSVVQV